MLLNLNAKFQNGNIFKFHITSCSEALTLDKDGELNRFS